MKIIVTNDCWSHGIRGETGCDKCLSSPVIEECYWPKSYCLVKHAGNKRCLRNVRRIHTTDISKCSCDPDLKYQFTDEEIASMRNYDEQSQFVYRPPKSNDQIKTTNIGFRGSDKIKRKE